MKKKSRTLVKAQITNKDRTLLLTTNEDSPEFYGLTICETKKASKKKIVNYEHLLFDRKKFENILRNVYFGKEEIKQYYTCNCGAEVLRIWHFPKDENDPEKWYFEVFDNYYLKCPRGIKDSIDLDIYNLEKLCDAICLDGRSDRCKKREEKEKFEFLRKLHEQRWKFNCILS